MGRKYCPSQEEILVRVYRKANILGPQNFLRGRFVVWASNCRCVEVARNNLKNIILESIERYILHIILRIYSDPEYYSKDVKKLKLKVRKAHGRRKLGQEYREELKRLSKRLLVAQKNAQETFLRSV
jgi:hypothetical protein